MSKLTLEPETQEGKQRPMSLSGPKTASEPDVLPDALWDDYLRDGGRDDRDRLVLHYTPLVRQVAGRVGTRLPAHVDLADLTQAGVFGLMDAIERFQPELGIRFEVYAAQRIRGAILDELRAQDWVPRAVRSRAREIAKARETVEARLQRKATPRELAEELGLEPAEVRGILTQIQVISLEALEQWAADRGITVSFAEAVAGEDSDPVALLEARENNRLLAESLARLPERDYQVLWLSYVENRTLAEIGRQFGVTESRACQLRRRALNRLREQFDQLTSIPHPKPKELGKLGGSWNGRGSPAFRRCTSDRERRKTRCRASKTGRVVSSP